MFASIISLTLGLIALLTFRDRVKYPRSSSKAVQKSLDAISKKIALGQFDDAEKSLAPLLQKGYGEQKTLLLHIQVLRGTKQYEEALTCAADASRLFPEELLFRLEEGKILVELGHPQEAIEAFNVCSPILRGEGDMMVLATALCGAGHAQQGFELIEKLLPTTRNGQLLALAGELCAKRKLYHDAIGYFNKAIAEGQKTHSLLTCLADAYRRLGNLAQATEIYREILGKDSADVVATLGLGGCMEERGLHHKALLIYQSGEAWTRMDARLLDAAGVAALRTKRYSFAERYFLDLLQIEEPSARVLCYYAFALENQKKWQEAEQVYLRCAQLFPSHANGAKALGWLFGVGLSTTLSHEQGLNFAHRALKFAGDPIAWEILSACEARVGNFAKAYQIQASLDTLDTEKESRYRRQRAMRKLRKNLPLDDNLVIRSLVA